MSILSQLINDKRYCLSNDEPLLKNCNNLNHNSLQNISKSDNSIYKYQNINDPDECIGRSSNIANNDDTYNVSYVNCNSDESRFNVVHEPDPDSNGNIAFSKTTDSLNNLKAYLYLIIDKNTTSDILINTLYEPVSSNSILKYYYLIKPIRFYLHNKNRCIYANNLTLYDIYTNSNATLECKLYHIIEDSYNGEIKKNYYHLKSKYDTFSENTLLNFEDVTEADINNKSDELNSILYFPPSINEDVQRELKNDNDDNSMFSEKKRKLVDYSYKNNIICHFGCKKNSNCTFNTSDYYFYNYDIENNKGQRLIGKKGNLDTYFSLNIVDNIDNFKFYYTNRNEHSTNYDYTNLDLVSYINPNRILRHSNNKLQYKNNTNNEGEPPDFKVIEGFDNVTHVKLKSLNFFEGNKDNIVKYLTNSKTNIDNIIKNADDEVIELLDGQAASHINYNKFITELNIIKEDINYFKENYSNINNFSLNRHNVLNNIITFKNIENTDSEYNNIIEQLNTIININDKITGIFKEKLTLSDNEIEYIKYLIVVLNFFKDNELMKYINRFYVYTNNNKNILEDNNSAYNKIKNVLNYNDNNMIFNISPLNSNNYNILGNVYTKLNSIKQSYDKLIDIKKIKSYKDTSNERNFYYTNSFDSVEILYYSKNILSFIGTLIEANYTYIKNLYQTMYVNGQLSINYYIYNTDELPKLTDITDVISFIHDGLIPLLNNNFGNNNMILNTYFNKSINSIDNLNISNNKIVIEFDSYPNDNSSSGKNNRGNHLLLLNNILIFISNCCDNNILPPAPEYWYDYYQYLSLGYHLYTYENLLSFFKNFKEKYSDIINTMITTALSDSEINIIPLKNVGKYEESFISSYKEGNTGNTKLSPDNKNFIKIKQQNPNSTEKNPIVNDIFNTNKFNYDLDSEDLGVISSSDLDNFSNNIASMIAPKSQFDFKNENQKFISCNDKSSFLYVDKTYKSLGNTYSTPSNPNIKGTKLQDDMFTKNVNYIGNDDVCNFESQAQLLIQTNKVILRYNNTNHELYNLNKLNLNNYVNDLMHINNGTCKSINTIKTKIYKNINDGKDYINSLHSYSGTESDFTQYYIENCNSDKKYYLSNNDDKVRLAIINGKLKLIFKINKIKNLDNKENPQKNSSVNSLINDGNKQEVYLYENKNFKNKIRSNFNKFVYVDSHKNVYNIPYINKNTTRFERSDVLYDINDKTSRATVNDCIQDPECIGYIDDKNGTSSDDKIKITNKNLKDVYISDSGSYFYQKVYTINKNNNSNENEIIKNISHITDENKTNLINTTKYTNDYDNNIKNDVNEFDNSSLIYNLLEKTKNNYNIKRKENDKLLEKLVTSFNKLSEDEINIINNTNSSLNDMKQMLDNYKHTINKIDKNKNIINMSQGRYNQFKDINEQSQVKYALMGVASITGLILLLQYIKK